MQGAEMEDEGSVLKYMTKSEIEEQRSSLLTMTQRPPEGNDRFIRVQHAYVPNDLR